jgi:hypothetical protein
VISNCVSSIAVCEIPALAILAIFEVKLMSDCSSSTRPEGIAMVVEMLKPYKGMVAACNNEIQHLREACTLP